MHKIIKILILSSLFFNLSAGLLGPIYAIFVQKIGGDILVASTSWAIYSAIIGMLMYVFGWLEDRVNRKKALIIGRIINTVGVAGYLFVNNPLDLYIVQGILGVALAVINPAWTALYSRSLDKGRESSEWSYWEGSVYITLGIAAIVGGTVATVFGFRVLFILMTISSAISTVVATLLLRKKMWEGFFRI